MKLNIIIIIIINLQLVKGPANCHSDNVSKSRRQQADSRLKRKEENKDERVIMGKDLV